jgi:hypothetical protein
MLDLEEYRSREHPEATTDWESAAPIAERWRCKVCGHYGFDVVGRTAPMLPGGSSGGDVTITVPPR